MTAYLIAYSVILFFVGAATVALSLLYVYGQKRKLSRLTYKAERAQEGDKIFADVYGEADGLAFILLEQDTRKPRYISANISKFLGVTKDELFADTQVYKTNLDHKFVRQFKREFNAWTGDGIFCMDFGYGEDNDKFAAVEAFVVEKNDRKYIAITVFDKTKQENERAAMQAELDTALTQAAAKSSFLSSMSHEIRTPMNGIMGMMSLARMNIKDPEKAGGYLERAGELSVFLLGMINDILDISKIESGKMRLYNTTFDVEAFAEKIKSMFNGMVTGKGIEFVVETVDFTSRYLECDELRLTQVVTNFVSNANKFTQSGGKITVTFKQLDKIGGNVQMLIRVRDTGKGIAPENIHKIMRPFEQEEASTTHNYGGTGLGLAICDQIIKLMGGNIVVDSELGKGTDFNVFLSLPEANAAAISEARATPAETESADIDFTFEDCKILLAEDNEVNAEIAVEILESEGATVKLAKDGQEALEMFTNAEDDAYDLLLLDIQMPRLNGRDAARAIRSSKKKYAKSVPIIALSADAFVEDVKLSEAAGMDAHVSKPIDFDELRKRSGEVIALKKSGGRR